MTRRGRILAIWVAIGAATASVAVASSAVAGNDLRFQQNVIREQLSGYQETLVALSTAGSGTFRIQIDEKAQEITYRLSYSGLEGTVTQAHIHFGARAQSGGVSVFICSNLGNGPAGTQACPAAPATVTGVIRPGDVIGPAAQGITAGQFAELVAAIRAGATYVNVHSTLYPGGEIRAQLEPHH
jgi:hypothetical protein